MFFHMAMQHSSPSVMRLSVWQGCEKWMIGILETTVYSCKWLVNTVNIAIENHFRQFSVTNKTFCPYEIRNINGMSGLKQDYYGHIIKCFLLSLLCY